MASYEVFHLSFSREDLLKVPEPELKFLLASAKLLNEICVLHRLLMIQHNDLGRDDADKQGRIAVYMFFLLQLAGKLWEVWQCLQQFYFSASWNTDHSAELSPEGTKALSDFKRAMSQKSPLDAIRNKVSVHADGSFLLAELRAAEAGHTYSAIIATDLLNTMYSFAEELSVRAAIRSFDPVGATQAGMDKMFDVVVGTARTAMEFLNDAVALSLTRHDVVQLNRAPFSVDHWPSLNDLRLPFLLRPLKRRDLVHEKPN